MEIKKLKTRVANLKSIIDYCERVGIEPKSGHVDAKKAELKEVELKLKELEK